MIRMGLGFGTYGWHSDLWVEYTEVDSVGRSPGHNMKQQTLASGIDKVLFRSSSHGTQSAANRRHGGFSRIMMARRRTYQRDMIAGIQWRKVRFIEHHTFHLKALNAHVSYTISFLAQKSPCLLDACQSAAASLLVLICPPPARDSRPFLPSFLPSKSVDHAFPSSMSHCASVTLPAAFHIDIPYLPIDLVVVRLLRYLNVPIGRYLIIGLRLQEILSRLLVVEIA